MEEEMCKNQKLHIITRLRQKEGNVFRILLCRNYYNIIIIMYKYLFGTLFRLKGLMVFNFEVRFEL